MLSAEAAPVKSFFFSFRFDGGIRKTRMALVQHFALGALRTWHLVHGTQHSDRFSARCLHMRAFSIAF